MPKLFLNYSLIVKPGDQKIIQEYLLYNIYIYIYIYITQTEIQENQDQVANIKEEE